MNVTQLMAQARIKLQDDGTRWPDAELIQWANEAEDELLLRTGLLEVTETLVAAADTPANSTYTIPAKCLKLKVVRYRGQALTERPVEDFDGLDWDTETGEPCSFYWADAQKIRTVPYLPAGATLLATMTRRGTALATGSDTPETPSVYHPFLVHGMVARAYGKDFEYKDPNKVAFHQGKFDEGVMLAHAHRPSPTHYVPFRRL